MKPLDRNIGALEHIVVYCQQIEQTVDRFGNNARHFGTTPFTAMPPHFVFCRSVSWWVS